MMHLFARGAFVLTAVVLAAMLIFGEASDSEDGLKGKTDGVFRECTDFLHKEVFMDGYVWVMQPIACNESVVIHVKGKLEFHAVNLNLTNLHFIVHSGGKLTLKARKSIKIQRNESSTKPLLIINGGEVRVEARGWIPNYANGTKEDVGGVVSMKEGGSFSVHTKSKATFTTNSITVVDMFRTHDEDDGDTVRPLPYEKTELFERRRRFEEYLRSKTNSTNNGGADHPHPPPETASADCSTTDDSDGTSKPEHAASSAPPPPPEQSGSDTRPTIAVPTPNSRWVKRGPWAKPRRSEIFVDKVLLGKLATDDDLAAIWGDYDGAVVFGRRPHVLTDGQQTRFEREKILIAPRPEKVDEVFHARAILRQMEAEGEGSENGSRNHWTRKELKMAKTAKEHLRRVDVVLTNRACLTVSLDGTCVLERSGRFKREWMNRFPWRRKQSDNCVLRATKDGLEVVDGEKRVWGISAGNLA